MNKKSWKIYGRVGHRQRESFFDSYSLDFSTIDKGMRLIEVLNSDITGTYEYSIISIIRETEEEVKAEIEGQLNDGIFENSVTGIVENILLNKKYYVDLYNYFEKISKSRKEAELPLSEDIKDFDFDNCSSHEFVDLVAGYYLSKCKDNEAAYENWKNDTKDKELTLKEKAIDYILKTFIDK